MLERLKEEVIEANLALVSAGLVFGTWGNASGIDRECGLVVIKPSGIAYEELRVDQMVVVDLEERVVEGGLRPSSDTPTHVALYKAFAGIGAVAHTHSHYATCWAQARRAIPCLGTTHADYFHGEVPVTDALTLEEIVRNYERHTGEVIVRRFSAIDPLHCPAVLVASHGPFAWGETPARAVENAAVLEEVARMALHTLWLEPDSPAIARELLDKHFLRKHGASAYYGQR